MYAHYSTWNQNTLVFTCTCTFTLVVPRLSPLWTPVDALTCNSKVSWLVRCPDSKEMWSITCPDQWGVLISGLLCGAYRLTAPIQSSVKYRVLKLVELYTGENKAGQFPSLPLPPPSLSSPNLLLPLLAVLFQSTCSKYPVSSLKNNFVEKAYMKNLVKPTHTIKRRRILQSTCTRML